MQPKICMYIFVIQMKTKKERMETASKMIPKECTEIHPSLSGMDVIVNRKKCVFALVISMDGNALIL